MRYLVLAAVLCSACSSLPWYTQRDCDPPTLRLRGPADQRVTAEAFGAAWTEAIVIVRDEDLCYDSASVIVSVYHYTEARAPACPPQARSSCVVDDGSDHYVIHLGHAASHNTLVHEALHIQMWRLGWADHHHARMRRLGHRW